MEAGQLWRQYVFAVFANIAMLSTGFCMGWTSPINPLLSSANGRESPLHSTPTTGELAWLGSLLNIGAIFGSIASGFIVSRIGRKYTLLSSMVPKYAGWVLVMTAHNIELLYLARMCWGFSLGIIVTILPMYSAEIATVDSRGALGSILQVFITLGFLLVYLVGPYLSYYGISYVGLSVCVAFTVLYTFAPESPTYHLLKGNRDAAVESLMKLRGRSRAGVEAELELAVMEVNTSLQKTASLADVFRGGNFKAFYICCALMFFQQFCGVNAVLFYLTDIFKASGLKIADTATIIVGAVQVLASCITPFVVDRLGRRILLLTSSSGTAIGLVFLGTFFVLSAQNNSAVEQIKFMPILSLVFFIIAYNIGLGPLPWAVTGEMFAIEVKTAASPIATAFNWTLGFLVTKFFPMIADIIGIYVGFFIFGGCCIIAFIFVLLLVPETKGKSLQEIQEILSGRKVTERNMKNLNTQSNLEAVPKTTVPLENVSNKNTQNL